MIELKIGDYFINDVGDIVKVESYNTNASDNITRFNCKVIFGHHRGAKPTYDNDGTFSFTTVPEFNMQKIITLEDNPEYFL